MADGVGGTGEPGGAGDAGDGNFGDGNFFALRDVGAGTASAADPWLVDEAPTVPTPVVDAALRARADPARADPAWSGRSGYHDYWDHSGSSRPPPAQAERRRAAAGAAGALVRAVGELLITAGLVVLLFVVYELWVTDLFAERSQHRLHTAIERTWATRPPVRVRPPVAPGIPQVRLGDGLAILRIPRFGRSYAPVVVEGVSTSDLQRGPGHYPGTALPGQVGNFVVSGHRTTYGHWFGQLDELRAGDPIVVEVADRYYTYLVTSRSVVAPTDLGVILPVPDRPGVRATHRILTFTTCNPKYSASTRLIVHAELHATTLKSRGLPAALREG